MDDCRFGPIVHHWNFGWLMWGQSSIDNRPFLMSQLFQKKSIDKLIADAASPGNQLRKSLGPWSLTALGIGAIIGGGIFVLTGTAAAGEALEVHSIFKAPLMDVLLHGAKALGTAGRPGAGPA